MVVETKDVKSCPGYEGCSAPICPLDSSFEKAIWYANEPICMSRTYRKEHWRIIQRKITKVHANKNPVSGFFNITLMNKMFRVTSKVKGLTERQGVPNAQDIEDFLSKASGSSDEPEVENSEDEENE